MTTTPYDKLAKALDGHVLNPQQLIKFMSDRVLKHGISQLSAADALKEMERVRQGTSTTPEIMRKLVKRTREMALDEDDEEPHKKAKT